MPVLDFDEIPRDAGQNFTAPGPNCHIIFYANATDTFDIHTRFYGNHISCFKSNRLPAGHPRRFVYFQPQTMSGTVHEICFEPALLQNFACRGSGG